jgi:TolB-like protein
MKNYFWGIILLVMLVMACAGGAKPAENSITDSSGMMTLDQALLEAATRIDERITGGSKIAPLNFNSPHDKFSSYVLDELTANLVDSRKLTVVDRKEVDLIRGEFNFQFSGEVGDDSMQELGRMLGAQTIISGSFTDMGNFYRIVIRVLNVQNASVEVQYRANIASDNITAALLTGGKTAPTVAAPQRTSTTQTPVVQAPATQVPAAPVAQIPAQTQVTPAPPPVTSYKVGDTGPAGGLIFYDKGNNSGGWQYLEAAPASTETKTRWGTKGTDAGGRKTGLGDGKDNTQSVLSAMNQLGESAPAVQYCVNLNVGGFRDWYLPSKAELNLIYSNLKMNGLGGFKNDWYWSSSENNSSTSWIQHFGENGRQRDYDKNDDGNIVRAIRRF